MLGGQNERSHGSAGAGVSPKIGSNLNRKALAISAPRFNPPHAQANQGNLYDLSGQTLTAEPPLVARMTFLLVSDTSCAVRQLLVAIST